MYSLGGQEHAEQTRGKGSGSCGSRQVEHESEESWQLKGPIIAWDGLGPALPAGQRLCSALVQLHLKLCVWALCTKM